jgi:predicted enzyme related to lactoylglutathione lyase
MGREGKDRKIDYVELPATDLAAMKRFYGDAFGWAFQDWGPDYVAFEGAGLDGGFRREDSVTPGGVLVLTYAVDLEATLARVEAAGGVVTVPIFAFPGGRRFQFRDPAGHELGVWSDVGVDPVEPPGDLG